MITKIRCALGAAGDTLKVYKQPNLFLTEDQFHEDALELAKFLRRSVPSATLDLVPEKLEMLRQELVDKIGARQDKENRRLDRIQKRSINRAWAYEMDHLGDYIND